MSPAAADSEALPAEVGLLERDDELQQLCAIVERLDHGVGAMVLIQGSAGTGKTTLLDAVAGTSGGTVQVLRAWGHELEKGLAFGVVRQLFESLLNRDGEAERGGVFEGAAALARPVLFGAPREVGDHDGRFAAQHGLYWLCANLATRRPIVLLIDDAHWADAPSIGWLSYLAHRVDSLAVALVVAARPGADDDDLIDRIATAADAVVVSLPPLSLAAVERLVQAKWRVSPSPEVVQMCFELSRGNPLALSEVLLRLQRDGFAATELADPAALAAASSGVARLLLDRIEVLGPDAILASRAVAILGSSTRAGAVAGLSGLSTEATVGALEALAAAGVIRLGTSIDFVHPVYRQAVYLDMSAVRRALDHRRAARILLDGGSPIDEAAAQLMLAEPAGDPEVVKCLREVGRDALGRGAPQAVVGYLRRALEEPAIDHARVDVLRDLAVAEAAVGGADISPLLAEAVGLSDDPRERAQLALLQARLIGNIGRFAEAIAALRAGLAEVAWVDDPELEALLEAELMGLLWTAGPVRRALDELAAFRRRRANSGGIAGQVLRLHEGVALVLTARDHARALRLIDDALASELLADHSVMMTIALNMLIFCDAFEAAEVGWSAVATRAQRTGSLLQVAHASLFRALLYTRWGRLEEARAEGELALRLARDCNWPRLEPWATAFLADALIDQGELKAADELLRDLGPAREWADGAIPKQLLVSRGRLRIARGDTAGGVEDLLACGQMLGPDGADSPAVVWRPDAALGLYRLGRGAEAAYLAEQELIVARRFGAPRALGIALRTRGLILGGAEGLELLQEAASVTASSPARFEHARTLIALGATLRRRNDRRGAREVLREGLALARAHRAAPLIQQAEEELRLAGAHTTRGGMRDRDTLTPSEARIARMASQGMTNRDIAQALFVTTKTVETHLGHAYTKLGITSREELNAAMTTAAELP
jgi:DNA-binding CsgD family transcriptional regulator